MPLFFILSGVLHSNSDNKTFVLKKFKSLLVPYFSFASILYVIWYFFSRNFGRMAANNTSPLKAFIGIFLGQTNISSIEWGISLWFLPCLFIVSFLFNNIIKLNKIYAIFLSISLGFIGWKMSNSLHIEIPWNFYTALVALPFYSFGYYFKDLFINHKYSLKVRELFFLIFLLIINLLTFKINGKTNMLNNLYQNIFLFYICAISGSLFLLLGFKSLDLKSKFLIFLGQNTLILLSFHIIAKSFIKIVYILLKIPFIENNFVYAFVYALIEILICLPLILMYNKFTQVSLKRYSF